MTLLEDSVSLQVIPFFFSVYDYFFSVYDYYEPDLIGCEICYNIVIDLVKEKLRFQLRNSDISVDHRLGKKLLTQGPDKRNIIVKLCSSDTKQKS